MLIKLVVSVLCHCKEQYYFTLFLQSHDTAWLVDKCTDSKLFSGGLCNAASTHDNAPSTIVVDDPDIDQYNKYMEHIGKKQQNMAMSLLKLKCDCHLTETALKTIQLWTEDLLEEALSSFVGGLKKCKTFVLTPEVEEMFHFGNGLANPFQGVETEYKRKQLLPYFVVSNNLFLMSTC